VIMVIGICTVPVVHFVTQRLLMIVATVSTGNPFVVVNAARLRAIAWALLGLELMHFAVGAVVSWARAGVGAVATQAAGRAAYGPEILDLLARGLQPADALERALADDERRETRQLGVVDARGRASAFTGSECNEWAGHATGPGYAAQGNILAGERVVAEMARAFEETLGALAERLVTALEAAQAAGGDRRGQQSAALVVERPGGIPESREGIDRIVDLRVDDHEEPIRELRRLLAIRVPELSAYQDTGYARAYADFVGRVAEAEQARVPGERQLAEAVAERRPRPDHEWLHSWLDADALVPVPLHPWRRLRRGFNQARDLAERLDRPVVDALWRSRATASQMALDAASRSTNVRGAFAHVPWTAVEDKIVVLIDDVRTTGATLDECAKVLRRAGASDVRALTVAAA